MQAIRGLQRVDPRKRRRRVKRLTPTPIICWPPPMCAKRAVRTTARPWRLASGSVDLRETATTARRATTIFEPDLFRARRKHKACRALLERMINIWPGERSYWTQLAGLYSNDRQATKRRSPSLKWLTAPVLLEREEAEIITLVNYYSFFDNPFPRRKVVVEREMEAGRVRTRSQHNLILLSQLWSQSREHKRAIPVLQSGRQSIRAPA